jgi:hypothetical protein
MTSAISVFGVPTPAGNHPDTRFSRESEPYVQLVVGGSRSVPVLDVTRWRMVARAGDHPIEPEPCVVLFRCPPTGDCPILTGSRRPALAMRRS